MELQISFQQKKKQVLIHCQSELLSFINNILFQQSPETLSDARYTSAEDMVSKFNRVQSGAVLILSTLYGWYFNFSREWDLNSELISIDLLSENELSVSKDNHFEILDNTSFWKMCTSNSAEIRKSLYVIIKSLSSNKEVFSFIQPRLSLVKKYFLEKAFTDKDPIVHTHLWDAILVIWSYLSHFTF
jgi:hypothetical protein